MLFKVTTKISTRFAICTLALTNQSDLPQAILDAKDDRFIALKHQLLVLQIWLEDPHNLSLTQFYNELKMFSLAYPQITTITPLLNRIKGGGLHLLHYFLEKLVYDGHIYLSSTITLEPRNDLEEYYDIPKSALVKYYETIGFRWSKEDTDLMTSTVGQVLQFCSERTTNIEIKTYLEKLVF